MPWSTDVSLPRDRVPVFPPRCVACGLADPADEYRATAGTVGLVQFFVPFAWFGRKHTAAAPACGPCAQAMRGQRVRRAVLLYASMAVVAFAVYHLYAGVAFPNRLVRRLAMIGTVVAALAPLAFWFVYDPPAFDMTRTGGRIDYEFRDLDYAVEFARLNATAGEDG